MTQDTSHQEGWDIAAVLLIVFALFIGLWCYIVRPRGWMVLIVLGISSLVISGAYHHAISNWANFDTELSQGVIIGMVFGALTFLYGIVEGACIAYCAMRGRSRPTHWNRPKPTPAPVQAPMAATRIDAMRGSTINSFPTTEQFAQTYTGWNTYLISED